MLGNDYSYFGIIRKSVTVFGTLFNEIFIERLNAAGDQVSLMKVPLTYAPKEKVLVRVDADPNLTKLAAVVLPRMSFEIADMRYDATRKLTSTGKIAAIEPTDATKLRRQFNPVPWNIDFNLYVYVKNAEDGTKIIEQILPYFTPDWTPTVRLVPEMDVVLDTPIVLNGIKIEDSYTGSFESRRALIWTLNFTMKTYLYGPIKTKPIVNIANTVFRVPNSDQELSESDIAYTVTVRPGQDANGVATTNSSITISKDEIFANGDFGFITEWTD